MPQGAISARKRRHQRHSPPLRVHPFAFRSGAARGTPSCVVSSPSRPEAPGGAALDDAWQAVLSDWDDGGAHERFLALSDAIGAAAEAGARYRAIRDEDPERAEEAQRRLDQLVARALARMQGARTEVSPRPRRWLFLLALLAASCLLMAAARMLAG